MPKSYVGEFEREPRLLSHLWVLACNVQVREFEMMRQQQERAELQEALEMKEEEVSFVKKCTRLHTREQGASAGVDSTSQCRIWH